VERRWADAAGCCDSEKQSDATSLPAREDELKSSRVARRFYCKYGIRYRDLAEMMQERGVAVDASMIFRSAQP
jgi:hypothetical protein